MSLERVDNSIDIVGGETDPVFLASPAADITSTDLTNIQALKDVEASKLLGRGDSGDGNYEEITLGSNLAMSGTTLNATGGGEVNTASNVNAGGVGVFKQKTGVNLEFKGINAGSNKITVTDDAGNSEIDIDVDESNLTITASQVTDFDTEVSNNTDVAANTTHRTSDGSDHTFIDQDVTSGSSPTFDGANFTGIPNGALSTNPLDRANHTGTQTASTISDFDTEVSNNASVTANTAKVSADGSIDTHSDVDTSTSPPSVGEVLEWDGSNWVPASSGTESPLPIISLTSTDTTTTINQSTPQVLAWDVEREKDSAFTHSNTVNNSRINIVDDGTYQIAANIRLESSAQRLQAVSRILINGVLQSQPYGSSYIRNSGNASDFWTCSVNPPPVKLNSGDYVEIQTQVESQATTTITGTFKGDESSFSAIQLKAFKGDKGDTGAGANIIVQENDSTIGTVNSTLNFEGSNLSVTDEGSNKATVAVDADKYYSQVAVNTVGGTVNAAYGSPLECVPSSGTLEIDVARTGEYLIHGKLNIGTDLNRDNGAIELAYGIDTGSGAVVGGQPWAQAQQAKKNRANGIQGLWGKVNLNAGDKVHLFLSTLGDSTTWTEAEIFIATWN